MNSLLANNPQVYKMFPWLWREIKYNAKFKKGILSNDNRHIIDMMVQAEDIMSKLRDDPRPEVQVPNVMADFKPDEN